MLSFSTTTTSTIQGDGDVLDVKVTNDFPGGLVAAAGMLRVCLNKARAAGIVTREQADAFYDGWVNDLEAACEDI